MVSFVFVEERQFNHKSVDTDRTPASKINRAGLDSLRPTIEKLMEVAGTAGLVVGVYHAGEEP